MPKTRRVTALVVMPVLFAAWVILFLFPTRTKALWGWEIRPSMSAVAMGAGYLGGVWFFSRVARARGDRSHEVAGGLLAATVFTTLLGITTVIHWEKFNYDHVSFWAWTFLYFVSPVFLFVLFRANYTRPDNADGSALIPRWASLTLGTVGAVQVVAALVWFADPEGFADRTPWVITPLSSRSLASFVAFTGSFLMWSLVDRRFLALRAGFEAVTVGLAGTAIGALVTRDDFVGPSSSRFGYGAGLVILLVFLVGLQVYMARTGGARPARVPAAAPGVEPAS